MVGSPLVIAEQARARLNAVLSAMRDGKPATVDGPAALNHFPALADLVVTPCEVNELHGTGTLLLRMFPDSSSVISLRTSNFYNGQQEFGAAQLCLPLAQAAAPEISSWLKWYLAGASIRRIMCLPYIPADAVVTIALKDMFGVPVCTYIMDDKNVCANGISDALMNDLLAKSDLRLVISPEMRDAYEQKYRMKFWVVPPLVPGKLIPTRPVTFPREADPRRGVLLGNIWGQRWLDLLRRTFRDSGFEVDWYCNHKDPKSLAFDRTEMERDGIYLRHPVDERDLPAVLSQYAYGVVPSDTLDGASPPAVQAIAELSLPSRIPTMIATSHLPLVVLGHPKTSAAGFVKRFELGEIAPYETGAMKGAVERLLRPDVQSAIRGRAADVARRLNSDGIADWIWRSLTAGRPCDLRFEDLMPSLNGSHAHGE